MKNYLLRLRNENQVLKNENEMLKNIIKSYCFIDNFDDGEVVRMICESYETSNFQDFKYIENLLENENTDFRAYNRFCIEYSSDHLLFVSDYGSPLESFYFILLDEQLKRIEKIDTYYECITTQDAINVIKRLLNDTSYDVEHEIELFKNSELFEVLKCNDDQCDIPLF